jgi:tetratricopeptide (TPR) repeat protein
MAIIAVLTLLLVAVVTGCDRAPRYDSRLVAADSLMQPDPDSALALVEAVEPGSLKAEGDSAYHRLLLTQGRYRCYVTATSDSDINCALAYYRRHDGEREKLTRTLIYKGAVMEELGHPDSAMAYYKTAETTAAPDDYFNLGYANLRIGALYTDYYVMDGDETMKYENALHYFRHTQDTLQLLIVLNNLGCHYRESRPDTAEKLLIEASRLAGQMNDTARIIYNYNSLIVLYKQYHNNDKAHALVKKVLSLNKPDMIGASLWFTISEVYSNLGMIDSATCFLECGKRLKTDDAQFNIYLLEASSCLALAKKDTLLALSLDQASQRMEDSLVSNSTKFNILNIDKTKEKELLNNSHNTLKKSTHLYRLAITIVIILLALLAIAFYYSRHRYDRLMADLREECRNQSIDLNRLQRNLNLLKITDESVNNALVSHMELMRSIIDECYHTPNSTLAKSIRAMVHFQNNNQGLWEKMYAYIDMQYNHIMSHTRRNYPQLNERDLMLLALTTLDYSCSQIAIILGYSNATSISTIRQRIAKKMGITGTLIEYTQSFKQDT